MKKFFIFISIVLVVSAAGCILLLNPFNFHMADLSGNDGEIGWYSGRDKDEFEKSETVKFSDELPYRYESEDDGARLISSFYHDKNLPIGAKVKLELDFGPGVYKNPSLNSTRLDCFTNGQIVTVAQITPWTIRNEENDQEEHWIKIISEDFQEGWVLEDWNTLYSTNPNPLCIKPNWKLYGSLGASFSPDGKYICLKEWAPHSHYGGALHVLEVETGKTVLDIEVAQAYDDNSSEYTVFSKDSKALFFEQNNRLYRIDLKSKKIKEYDSPFPEKGELGEMLMNEEGDEILFVYNWTNGMVLSTVWHLKYDSYTNYTSVEEAEEIYRKFAGKEIKFNPEMPDFEEVKNWKFIPEKNLALCAPWNNEKFLSGIYFFELDTGKFIKAENPVMGENEESCIVEDFEINKDGTKIAVHTAEPDYRVTEMTYYICDLNLTDFTVTVPKPVKNEANEALRDAREYLCKQGFSVYGANDENDFEWKYRIWFDYDNTYSTSYGPNSDTYTGTYTLEYDEGKVKVSFDPLFTCNEPDYFSSGAENIEKYLSDGYIDTEISDFFSRGGVVYADEWELRFIKSDVASEPFKEYEFRGQRVIKYPSGHDTECTRIYPQENLKMRQAPSADAELVHLPFYGYIADELCDIDDRTVVYAGQQFTVRASSVEKDHIGDTEAYWYLIYVVTDELDEWQDGKYVWIYGGYAELDGPGPDGVRYYR